MESSLILATEAFHKAKQRSAVSEEVRDLLLSWSIRSRVAVFVRISAPNFVSAFFLIDHPSGVLYATPPVTTDNSTRLRHMSPKKKILSGVLPNGHQTDPDDLKMTDELSSPN